MAVKDYTLIFGNGTFSNNIKVFIVDELSDRDYINVSQLLPGSKVYVINDAQWYILSNEMEWESYSEGGQSLPEGSAGQYVGYNSEGEGVALSPDSTPTNGSANLVTSDGIYDALATKQNTLTFDNAPVVNSSNPVKSSGIYSAIQNAIASIPKAIVWKGAVNYYNELPVKPEEGDAYTVLYKGDKDKVSDGTEYVWGELDKTYQWIALGPDLTTIIELINTKQDTLTFDNIPINGSDNPVKSGGIYSALVGKQNTLTFDSTPIKDSTNPVTSGGIHNALAEKEDIPITHELTLASADWSSAEQIVEVPGVLADESKQLIFITPKTVSRAAFEAGGIRAISQAADALTFKYDNAPSGDIDVFVTILNTKVAAPIPKPYIKFSADSGFILYRYCPYVTWNGTIETSPDGSVWTSWDGTTEVSSSNDGELYVRGYNNTRINYLSDQDFGWLFKGQNDEPTPYVSCEGNLMTLLDYENPPTEITTTGCFNRLFQYNEYLTSAPDILTTTVSENCCAEMFSGCTSLVTPPILSATTIAPSCYSSMFSGCASLETAPALPATTLADSCYSGMFVYCDLLTSIPALPATTLAESCYAGMFTGCPLIKLSETQTGEYTQEYRIPISGTGSSGDYALDDMFGETGGTFTGTPDINTTYYLSNTNAIVPANA